MNKHKLNSSGAIWIFEGPDGVGKSSIIEEVEKRLLEKDIKVCSLSFPGQRPHSVGKLIYDLHHEPEQFNLRDVPPLSLQMLHISAHIDCIENEIKPAIKDGQIVLLDRNWWSTWVYGITAGIKPRPLKKVIELELYFWKKIKNIELFLIQSETPYKSISDKSQWLSLNKEYNKLAENSLFRTRKIQNNQGDMNKNIELITQTIIDSQPSKLNIICKKSAIKATTVYDTYWRFAAERQKIFFKRARGESLPWTNDPIFIASKFTNAYRASDRVSQYLIKNVIYDENFLGSSRDVFFRIMLFKLFNRISTWELLKEELGEIYYKDYDFSRYDEILGNSISSGNRIYSAAYIMPSGKSSFGYNFKHQNNLKLIELMIKENLPDKIIGAASMSHVFDMLKACPTIGNFLAYQLTIDLNYSTLTDFDEMSFVCPGPGAKDGIKKCFSSNGEMTDADLIKKITDEQDEQFDRLEIKFEDLCGRKLQLIDCQNLFCEVDKYSRVAHPELLGISGRSRIKQKLKINNDPIKYFYPPKWNINKKMEKIQKNVYHQGILI
jgi:thymidylate kinase